MKILHVITSLLSGGAEKLMVDLLPRYRDMGFDTEIAVFNAVETDFMRRLNESGIRVHRFCPDGCNVYSPVNLFRLSRLISSGGYDIVHTHNTAPQLFAALCRKSGSTRLVTTEHNSTNRRRRYAVLSLIDRWMYSRYDSVVSISEGTRQALADFIGGSSGKFVVINNGIDLSVYSSEPRPIASGQDVIITMVAGFRPQKDQDTLIRALAMLPDRFRLRLVGDGERRHDIESLVSDLGLRERVTLLGIRPDIPQIISDSDIVVLSSHYEGLSLSSVEGMASGRPFVASDVPGLHEVVEGHGILFPHRDHAALSAVLMRLADDSQYYYDTVIRCQRRAADFDINNTARQYADLYHQLHSDCHV